MPQKKWKHHLPAFGRIVIPKLPAQSFRGSSGRLGALSRLTEVHDVVPCEPILVHAASDKLNLELMCISEVLHADLFILTVSD
jgi:hypothetical protein